MTMMSRMLTEPTKPGTRTLPINRSKHTTMVKTMVNLTGVVTVLAGGLSVLSQHGEFSSRFVWPYRVLLLASAGLVGATGHFGAVLIYGFEHFQW